MTHVRIEQRIRMLQSSQMLASGFFKFWSYAHRGPARYDKIAYAAICHRAWRWRFKEEKSKGELFITSTEENDLAQHLNRRPNQNTPFPLNT